MTLPLKAAVYNALAEAIVHSLSCDAAAYVIAIVCVSGLEWCA
jgi:hypothetical protein